MKKRGILRLHHDELDEPLRHLARLGVGLDFGHGEKLIDHEQEHEFPIHFPGGRTSAST